MKKLFFVLFFFSFEVFGQNPTVDHALKRDQYEIIDSLSKLIRRYHVDTLEGRKVILALREKLEAKGYAAYTSNKIEFTESVSADLQRFSQNSGFRLTYTPFLDLYLSVPQVPAFGFEISQKNGEKQNLMLEYPSTFLPQADYAVFPLGDIPKYLYNPQFQKKIRSQMYSHWLQTLGVEIHKLDFKGSKESEISFLKQKAKANLKPVELNKKWLRKARLNDWQGVYLMPNAQWETELVDQERYEPYEYGTKKSKKTLFSRMISLKQQIRHFGFSELKTLEGNMAYLKIDSWANLFYTNPKILNPIMGYLAEHEAIILDLRGNWQGDPSLLAVFCSYFLPPKKTALLAQYQGQTLQTLPKLKGKPDRLHEKQIYILRDSTTSGTSEILIQFLKKYNQAKIIGSGATPRPMLTHRFPLEAGRMYADIPVAEIILPEKNAQLLDIQTINEFALQTAKADFFLSKKEKTNYKPSEFYYQYLVNCELGQKSSKQIQKDSLEKYKGEFAFGKRVVWEDDKAYLVEKQGRRQMFLLGNVWAVEKAYGTEINAFDYAHPIAGTAARIAYIDFVMNRKTKRFDMHVTYSNREESIIPKK